MVGFREVDSQSINHAFSTTLTSVTCFRSGLNAQQTHRRLVNRLLRLQRIAPPGDVIMHCMC
jgi:hypothetical protein